MGRYTSKLQNIQEANVRLENNFLYERSYKLITEQKVSFSLQTHKTDIVIGDRVFNDNAFNLPKPIKKVNLEAGEYIAVGQNAMSVILTSDYGYTGYFCANCVEAMRCANLCNSDSKITVDANGKIMTSLGNKGKDPSIEVTKLFYLDLNQLPKYEAKEEKKYKVVEINQPSDIPDDLVKNPPPVGVYEQTKGHYDEKGFYAEFKTNDGILYKVRVIGPPSIGMETGKITADYNKIFLTKEIPEGTGAIYFDSGPINGIPAENLIGDPNEKWIGFTSNSMNFACLKTKNGKFECHKYGFYSDKK
jgi:hypothetical protein